MNLSLDDLTNDADFLDGLRNGNFCLVLGAGFSYGLRNKITENDLATIPNITYEEFKNIPLAFRFISLTNKIFNEDTRKYQAAANIWEDKFSRTDIDFTSVFVNLFSVDKEYFKEGAFNHYKNILIPNWHHIYTFNFDDVVESIYQLSNKENYYTRHYPEHTNLEKSFNTAVVHLHGFIKETSPLDLIFSDDAYERLRNAKHSLYDSLFGDVNDGKKLIIIGTQFDEDVIDDKFFDGLKDKNIFIYHFDISNNDFRTKPGIRNNPNYHFIALNTDTGIKPLLEFLDINKDKILNLSFDGADVINATFIEKVKKEHFLPEQFYIAKQDNNCQWYGIIHNWDAPRNDFAKIKVVVLKSFEDKSRSSRLSAWIFGRGGSGKSTLLRRLAVDCINESFHILWVKDTQATDFFENTISEIDKHHDKQFLVIIEDWYRIKQNTSHEIEKTGNRLQELFNLSNVRVVIGDRLNSDNICSKNLFSSNKFELKPQENRDILSHILGRVEKWKSTIEDILAKNELYTTSLYIILWVIARINAVENPVPLINFKDLINKVFIEIIKSDVKKIAGTRYKGLAMALHYWACVFKTNKIYIEYGSFKFIADYFNGNSEITQYSDQSKEIQELLSIYINVGKGKAKPTKALDLLSFNHDLIAEVGLSNPEIARTNGWENFDLAVKKRILDVVVNKADDFSASNYLNYFLKGKSTHTISNKEKLNYILRLFQKGNWGSYLNHLFSKQFEISSSNLNRFANIILQGNKAADLDLSTILLALKQLPKQNLGKNLATQILTRYKTEKSNHQVICKCLEILRDSKKGRTFATQILTRYKTEKLDNQVICKCLEILRDSKKGKNLATQVLTRYETEKISNDVICKCLETIKETEEGRTFATQILTRYKTEKLDNQVICKCLEILRDSKKGRTFATQVLTRYETEKISNDVICKCLETIKETEEGRTFAKYLLTRYKTEKISNDVTCRCLETLKETEEGKNFAKNLLAQYKTEKISTEITCRCLDILRDSEEGKNFAKDLLTHYKTEKILNDVICKCLDILRDSEEGKNFAKDLLTRYKIEKISNEIICRCLWTLKETEEGKNFASNLLGKGNWEKENWGIVYHSLECLASSDIIPPFAEKIVNKIIQDYFCVKRPFLFKLRYTNLLRLPFHKIPNWKKTTNYIIQNWENAPRNIVVNVLISYRFYPDKIEHLCRTILNNWQNELHKPIKITFQVIQYGNHIKLAMGHPKLNGLSKKVAVQMQEKEEQLPGSIPNYLLEVVKRIQANKEFPNWQKDNSEEESITE